MARFALKVLAALLVVVAVAAQDADLQGLRNIRNRRDNENACRFDTMWEAIEFAARNRPELTTFVRAIRTARLPEGNPRREKLTILAPINEAFQQFLRDEDIPSIDALLSEANRPLLERTLRMHILREGPLFTQLAKNNLVLDTSNPGVTVTVNVGNEDKPRRITFVGPRNRATVVDPDNIKVCKSVMHAVDAVLRAPEAEGDGMA